MPDEGTPIPGATPQGEGTPQADTKYTVKVDGEDRQFTLDELKQHASKAAAADRRFEEAARLKKELQDAQELKELLDSNPDLVDAIEQAMQQGERPRDQRGRFRGSDDDSQYGDDETPLTRAQISQLMAQQQEAILGQIQLQRDLEVLHGEYGEFDDMELLKYCDDNGLYNVRKAYRDWKSDDIEKAKIQKAIEEHVKGLKDKRMLTEPKAGGEGGIRVPLNIDPHGTLDDFARKVAQDIEAGGLKLDKE